MLQLYFQNEDPISIFCLIPRKMDRLMWTNIRQHTANGGKFLQSGVNFRTSATVFHECDRPAYRLCKSSDRWSWEKTASLTLNRATDTRQPGSTFKIVSTYAPALNEKGNDSCNNL